jgi:ABC-type multidrug transport system permease subunit
VPHHEIFRLLIANHSCAAAIGGQLINCSDQELVTLQPPSGQTCGSFLAGYISHMGGYLTNSDAASDCRFCSSRTTDEWMGPTFNIFYRHHWRNFGIFCAYIVFNVRRILFLPSSEVKLIVVSTGFPCVFLDLLS